MNEQKRQCCTAFQGNRCIASGNVLNVIRKTKEVIDQGTQDSILIFDDATSEIIEADFRGTAENVIQKFKKSMTEEPSDNDLPNMEQKSQRRPGRPKLGVVGREVTLLPRHWEWLSDQPGGASVTLRKLVEEARRANRGRDKIRRCQESAYRFMSAMAGDLPGFEEASRALFAEDSKRFNDYIAVWPEDLKKHVEKISKGVFENSKDRKIL